MNNLYLDVGASILHTWQGRFGCIDYRNRFTSAIYVAVTKYPLLSHANGTILTTYYNIIGISIRLMFINIPIKDPYTF